MKKTINRTVKVTTGKQLVPNYENRCFDEKEVTLLDCDKVPENVHAENTCMVRASMPLEQFFELANKSVVGQQEAMSPDQIDE